MGFFDRFKKDDGAEKPQGSVTSQSSEPRTQEQDLKRAENSATRSDRGIEQSLRAERDEGQRIIGEIERESGFVDPKARNSGVGMGIGVTIDKDGVRVGLASPEDRMSTLNDQLAESDLSSKELKALDGVLQDRNGSSVAEYEAFKEKSDFVSEKRQTVIGQAFNAPFHDNIDGYDAMKRAGGSMEEFDKLRDGLGEDNEWRLSMSNYIEAKQNDTLDIYMDGVKGDISRAEQEQKIQDKVDSGKYTEVADASTDTPEAEKTDSPEDVAKAQAEAGKTGAAQSLADTGAKPTDAQLQDGQNVADASKQIGENQAAEIGGPGNMA